MPVKSNFNPDYLYFVTTTVVNHSHLFRREDFIRIILDSFHYLRTVRRVQFFIFVIMPNHIHFIARFRDEYKLSDAMRDFKRHTARQIIRQLQVENNQKMLDVLRKASNDKSQEFKVWEDGYDARDVFSVEFLERKMNYIHYNPCQPQWKLVDLPEEYPWSSARFYLVDIPAITPVDDVRDFLFSSCEGLAPAKRKRDPMPKIHFNGKTYNDLAEMPATEREAYEQLMAIFKDEDQDGTPDIFQGDVVSNIIDVVKKTSGDPEGAAALERMSPLMRARLSKGIAKLYALGLITGRPDLPHEWPFSPSEATPAEKDMEIRPSQPIIQLPSAIQEDSGPRLGLILTFALLLALCVFGAVAFYLLQ